MMHVGIFTGYYPYGLEGTAKKIQAQGMTTVQLDLTFKDMDLSTEGITKEKCRTIRNVFRDHNLPICCVSGYTNIVHPDKAERRKRLDHLKTIIRHARDLGSPYVISETGTFATDSDWVSHPKNKTEEGFHDCAEVIRELVQVAYDHGATFLLETYVNNVVGSVNETLRMFSAINHSSLGLLMDPTNYFEAHNIGDMEGELDRVFNALSDKIRIAHAKDVKLAGANKDEKHAELFEGAAESHTFRGVGQIELPAAGLGALNYDHYLKRLAEHHPNIPVIIEHLDEADVPRAKKFIDDKLRAHGL
jgi:sugar phosphate isomerase/epimerase